MTLLSCRAADLVPPLLSVVYPVISTWLLQLPLRSPRSAEGPESMFSLSPALPLNNTTTLLGRYLPGSFVDSQTVSSHSDSLEPRHVYHLRSFKKGRLASPRSWAVPNPNMSVSMSQGCEGCGDQGSCTVPLRSTSGNFPGQLGRGVSCYPLTHCLCCWNLISLPSWSNSS